MKTWLHTGVKGFVKGSSVEDICYATMMEIEMAQHCQTPISGAILDIVKCFDNLQHEPIMKLFRKAGLPSNFLKIWSSFVTKQTRFFRVNGEFSSSMRPTCGFGQGDPLSILPTLMLGHLYCSRVEKVAQGTSVTAYADNFAYNCLCPERAIDILNLSLIHI